MAVIIMNINITFCNTLKEGGFIVTPSVVFYIDKSIKLQEPTKYSLMIAWIIFGIDIKIGGES